MSNITEKDLDWLNGISPYMFMIKEINEHFLELLNSEFDIEVMNTKFNYMAIQISRIIQIKKKDEERHKFSLGPLTIEFRKKLKEIEKYEDKFHLSKQGMMKVKVPGINIKAKYTALFNKHKKILTDLKQVRDKLEHVPHNIDQPYHNGGNPYLENKIQHKGIKFSLKKYEGQKIMPPYTKRLLKKEKKAEIMFRWEISTKYLSALIIDLNNIFLEIQNIFSIYLKTNTAYNTKPYYKNIIQIDLNDYNKRLTEALEEI